MISRQIADNFSVCIHELWNQINRVTISTYISHHCLKMELPFPPLKLQSVFYSDGICGEGSSMAIILDRASTA